jgi:hypothetical protein
MKQHSDAEQVKSVHEALSNAVEFSLGIKAETKELPLTFMGLCQSLAWDDCKDSLPSVAGIHFSDKSCLAYRDDVTDDATSPEEVIVVAYNPTQLDSKKTELMNAFEAYHMELEQNNTQGVFLDYVVLAVAYAYMKNCSFSAEINETVHNANSFIQDPTMQQKFAQMAQADESKLKLLGDKVSQAVENIKALSVSSEAKADSSGVAHVVGTVFKKPPTQQEIDAPAPPPTSPGGK